MPKNDLQRRRTVTRTFVDEVRRMSVRFRKPYPPGLEKLPARENRNALQPPTPPDAVIASRRTPSPVVHWIDLFPDLEPEQNHESLPVTPGRALSTIEVGGDPARMTTEADGLDIPILPAPFLLDTPSRALTVSEVDELDFVSFYRRQFPLSPTPSLPLTPGRWLTDQMPQPQPPIPSASPPISVGTGFTGVVVPSPTLPPLYTEEQMADKITAATGLEEWSPALRASLVTLRPAGAKPNRRQRCRLTNGQGQTIRITIPSDSVLFP